MLLRFKNAFHNIVLHPIAGILWLVGLQRTGDWVHGTDTDEANLEAAYPLLEFFGPTEKRFAENRRRAVIEARIAEGLEQASVWEDAGTMTNEDGGVIKLYEGNFVDGNGNGAEAPGWEEACFPSS